MGEQPGAVEALVRRHLDAVGGDIDAAALLARALARRRRDRDRWRRLLLGVPVGLAAGLLLAVVLAAPAGRVQASPAEVVERAALAHIDPVDRAYRLRTEVTGPLRAHFAALGLDRDVTLWTRGDRFRVAPALGGKGVWGRDELGRVWVAPTPRAGALFGPREVPAALQESLALRSVDLGRLLGVALRDCELTPVSWRPGLPLDTRRIEAVARASTPGGVQYAVVDVGPDDHVVRHLALRRRVPGGTLTLTLDLQGALPQPDDSYRLEGHLAPGGRVYDKTRPANRAALLLKSGLRAVRESRP